MVEIKEREVRGRRQSLDHQTLKSKVVVWHRREEAKALSKSLRDCEKKKKKKIEKEKKRRLSLRVREACEGKFKRI